MKICSVNGCGSMATTKGWCKSHYMRWWRYGRADVPLRDRSEYIPSGENSPNYKHGKWDHPLYKTWRNMLSRCNNPDDHAYRHYGGRGISVCDRWHDIRVFIEDVGERPPNTWMDRTDNNGNYEPSNFRWATYAQSCRNRNYVKLSIEKAGEIRSLHREGILRQSIADDYGVSLATVKKIVSGQYWKEL